MLSFVLRKNSRWVAGRQAKMLSLRLLLPFLPLQQLALRCQTQICQHQYQLQVISSFYHHNKTFIASILASNNDTTKILIAHHTTQQNIGERLKQGLVDQSLQCYLINENTPNSLDIRAKLVQWCDVFVIIISRLYQRTPFCMETLDYAKDIRKSVIAVLAEPNFRPYGALGAISASAVRSIVLSDDQSLVHAVSEITTSARTQIKKKPNTINIQDLLEVMISTFDLR